MILDPKRNPSPRLARGRTLALTALAAATALLAFQLGPRIAFAQPGEDSLTLPRGEKVKADETIEASVTAEAETVVELASPVVELVADVVVTEEADLISELSVPKAKESRTITITPRAAQAPGGAAGSATVRRSAVISQVAPAQARPRRIQRSEAAPQVPLAQPQHPARPFTTPPAPQPFPEPANLHRPERHHRSIEERLDRLERMVETLLEQRRHGGQTNPYSNDATQPGWHNVPGAPKPNPFMDNQYRDAHPGGGGSFQPHAPHAPGSTSFHPGEAAHIREQAKREAEQVVRELQQASREAEQAAREANMAKREFQRAVQEAQRAQASSDRTRIERRETFSRTLADTLSDEERGEASLDLRQRELNGKRLMLELEMAEIQKQLERIRKEHGRVQQELKEKFEDEKRGDLDAGKRKQKDAPKEKEQDDGVTNRGSDSGFLFN